MTRALLLSALLAALAFPAYGGDTAPQSHVHVVEPGERFSCTPTHVWDGDGPIWCEEGVRIRLSGINAREMDEPSCKPDFPCVNVSGVEARDALVSLIGEPTGEVSTHGHILVTGPTMNCLSTGSASGNRTGAFCTSPKSGDLSCAMVEGGWTGKWAKYWGDHSCEAIE